MSYIVLFRSPKAKAWTADPKLCDAEHSAAARQKVLERANPGIQTRRDWIEL